MTFVSALFSRTHFNANCFAVLNESFKVISLFSYQSSLYLAVVQQLLYLIRHSSVCQQLFYFSFKLFHALYFNSSFRLTYLSYPVNNFFTFFWQRIYIKNRRIPCRLHVFPVNLSHQRQLANSITLAFKSQPLFTVLPKKDNSCFFAELSFFFIHIIFVITHHLQKWESQLRLR